MQTGNDNTMKDTGASCPLCGSASSFLLHFRDTGYRGCHGCGGVFMEPAYRPSPEREKERYEKHNNDINDRGYRNFVRPLVKMVTRYHGPGERGLDFGAGTGPVAASLLQEQGYDISLYDPFFCNDPGKLEVKYDFIICCEVMEHFHDPAGEFRLLRSLLNTGGNLFCMTGLLLPGTDFKKWWYKNDETHVFFYTPESIAWIGENLAFLPEIAGSNLVRFTSV